MKKWFLALVFSVFLSVSAHAQTIFPGILCQNEQVAVLLTETASRNTMEANFLLQEALNVGVCIGTSGVLPVEFISSVRKVDVNGEKVHVFKVEMPNGVLAYSFLYEKVLLEQLGKGL